MDIGSHLLSGIAIAIALPDDPCPVRNYLQKGLVVVGAIIPDVIVTFIWQNVSKKIGKGGPEALLVSI
jgi:hypothetical protein